MAYRILAFVIVYLLSANYSYASPANTEEVYKRISVQNSSGRRGVYFLPQNYRSKRLPILLLLHGSSIDGAAVARIFKGLARKKKFIMIAPDSVNGFGWEISLDLTSPTEDQIHIGNCLAEVLRLRGVRAKAAKFLIAGISAGGEVAAFQGSNETRYTSFAVLHGGVHLPSLGSNVVPVWLSTGTQDELRPPSELMSYQTSLLERSFSDVTYNEYDVGHEIKPEERKALIKWWLRSQAAT